MAKLTKGSPVRHRLTTLSAALLLLGSSPALKALGLGEIEMQSTLNQPMNAAIELTSAANTDLSTVSVTLASPAAHQRIGLSRSQVLSDFDFNIEKDASGNAIVRVTSRRAVQEPFIEFLLELAWPNGRLLREYTVLVDPPLTMPATPARPVSPVSRAPAVTPAPATPVPVTRAPATSVTRSASRTSGADSYGPIRRNETLWSIAEQLRPAGVSTHQMMLALQRKNPQAFVNNNINNLQAGVTLAVPTRDEIAGMSASEAFSESQRQYSEWSENPVAEPAAVTATDAGSSATESRLQLMAPDMQSVEGAAAAGDPVEATAGETGADSASDLNQQLAMANEEVETSRAETAQFRSQVSELEQQVETMKRLLELKDEELASMQQRLAADSEAQPVPAGESDSAEMAAGSDVENVAETEETVAEATPEPVAVAEPVADASESKQTGGSILGTLLGNPLWAGLGGLAVLLVGGLAWSASRRKSASGPFDDELTLQHQLQDEPHTAALAENVATDDVDAEQDSAETEHADIASPADEGDPLTEADVYLAYGRIQQAEDVLQSALAEAPDDSAIRVKLLEVYHAAGNVAAFDRAAAELRDSLGEDDATWQQVAAMGLVLSPDNSLYQSAGEEGSDNVVEFDGMPDVGLSEVVVDAPVAEAEPVIEEVVANAPELPESIEFTLDDADEEDASEGLLDTSDEVTTKLDLARAYLDMGDPEGARSILGEVMEEGNDEQKNEAEALIAKLA